MPKTEQLNVSSLPVETALTHVAKPDYCITFHHEGGEVGRLDFNGPKMVFTGDAEQSATKLFELVAVYFSARLKEEYERGLTDGAKHDRP